MADPGGWFRSEAEWEKGKSCRVPGPSLWESQGSWEMLWPGQLREVNSRSPVPTKVGQKREGFIWTSPMLLPCTGAWIEPMTGYQVPIGCRKGGPVLSLPLPAAVLAGQAPARRGSMKRTRVWEASTR